MDNIRSWPGAIQNCAECGGERRYAGLGELRCVECGNVQLNDYGRVRAYLEAHPGAMQSEVSRATGVSTNRIRQLLVEERIEISANSNIFLNCEMCGMPIRSGSRCPKCEERYQREMALEKKAERVGSIKSGHMAGDKMNASGEMRFLKK